MHDVWAERWIVDSLTEIGKTYTVARKKADGSYGCSCPAWKFHRAPKVDCKHIKAMLLALVDVLSRRGRLFLDGVDVTPAMITAKAPTRRIVDALSDGFRTAPVEVTVGTERMAVKRMFLEA